MGAGAGEIRAGGGDVVVVVDGWMSLVGGWGLEGCVCLGRGPRRKSGAGGRHNGVKEKQRNGNRNNSKPQKVVIGPVLGDAWFFLRAS